MRVANGAIPRVNSITPSIDKLIQELNGAEVFSHLDMRHLPKQSKRRAHTQHIPGMINISNDILVTGRNQQEHDQRLELLLETAREKNVTFNKSKCEFSQNKCLYLG